MNFLSILGVAVKEPTEMDRLLAMVVANWDSPGWTDERLSLFLDELHRLDEATARAAVTHLIRTCKEVRVKLAHLHESIVAVATSHRDVDRERKERQDRIAWEREKGKKVVQLTSRIGRRL